jgi:NMD protein affecting ribosome stability and mRNA decay
VKNRKCENCIKISGGYYEAVLQARGEHTERISKKIMSMAKESVVSVKQLKEGYDILLTDKKIAAKIATQLGNYFDIRSSYKFVGEKKGKKLYRNYYAIR